MSAWGEGLGEGGLPLRRPAPTLPPISEALMGPPSARRFAARPDCGSKYQLCVQLLSSAHAPLGTFQPDPATIQQKSDAKWREVCELGRGQVAYCPRLRLQSNGPGFGSQLCCFSPGHQLLELEKTSAKWCW